MTTSTLNNNLMTYAILSRPSGRTSDIGVLDMDVVAVISHSSFAGRVHYDDSNDTIISAMGS